MRAIQLPLFFLFKRSWLCMNTHTCQKNNVDVNRSEVQRLLEKLNKVLQGLYFYLINVNSYTQEHDTENQQKVCIHSFHIIYNQYETQTGINTIPSSLYVLMETFTGMRIEKKPNKTKPQTLEVLKLVCIKKSMSTMKIQSLLFPISQCQSTSFSLCLGSWA